MLQFARNRRVVRSAARVSVVVCLGLLAHAGAAAARTEVVSWSHVMPCSVDGFELRYGPDPENLTSIDVGRPRQAGGHFSHALELPDEDAVYVCVAAFRGEQMSDCSTGVTLSPSPIGSPRSQPAPSADNRLWCEDFSGGTYPPGWLPTGPAFSLQPAPSLFAPVAREDGNFALGTSSPDADIHSHFVGTSNDGLPSPQWSRYEYSGQMQFSHVDSGVGVTLYSQFNVATGYYRLGRSPQGNFLLERNQENPTFNCEPGLATPTIALPGIWYAFRIQVEDQSLHTRLQTKVWRADKREPEGFHWVCRDSAQNRRLSGAVGVWATGPGMKQWDDLNVAELAEPSASDPLGAPGKPELVP